MSTKKAKQLRFSDDEDSSSDDEPLIRLSSLKKTPKQEKDVNDDSKKTRSSDRINRKRNKEFHMPTRESIYKEIPEIKSPNKSWSHLQPRKLINDFTKITSRYNQREDNDWSSDSESNFVVDDFVEVESETNSSSASDENDRKKGVVPKKPRKGKVKRLRRVSKPSSDTDNSEEDLGNQGEDNTEVKQYISPDSALPGKSNEINEENGAAVELASSDEDEDEAIVMKKPAKNIIKSDHESDNNNDDTVVTKKAVKNIIESDQESEAGDNDCVPLLSLNASTSNDAALPTSPVSNAPDSIKSETKTGESESGSGESESGTSESESGTDEDSDGVRSNSKRAKLMKKRKDNWRKKFEEYREKKIAKTKKS